MSGSLGRERSTRASIAASDGGESGQARRPSGRRWGEASHLDTRAESQSRSDESGNGHWSVRARGS